MPPDEMPLILERDARGVARLLLNRPERRNALSAALVAALHQRLAELAGDPAVRIVLLTGAGAAFCGGADIGEMGEAGRAATAENVADAQRFAAMLDQLDRMPQPTLAIVNGPAFGGALGLVCACDIALAADSARFALSEVRLGLVPAMISPLVLRAIGARQAGRWFLGGDAMDAATALRIGLVHETVPAGELAGRTEAMLHALLAGGPAALAEAKQLIRRVSARGPAGDDDLRDETARWIARLRAGDEAREGLAAFLEKRAPGWTKGG